MMNVELQNERELYAHSSFIIDHLTFNMSGRSAAR